MQTFRYNITSYTNESINSSLDRNKFCNDINDDYRKKNFIIKIINFVKRYF